MASDGSNGPKPWKQRHASTVFLRVPTVDWIEVTRGMKTEFRGSPGAVSGLKFVEPPTPVVAYRVDRSHGYDAALMVLEDRWQEELGSISPESLEAEGFETFAEFRRYFVLRERRRFRLTRKVTVYRLRPWDPEADPRRFADLLLDRLFGAFLPA
jgi:hypothetical protein